MEQTKMSSTAKTAREAMKAKAKRLASADPHTKVDSSTWTPPEALDADVKTGARPLTKRLYKKGGKVIGKTVGTASQKRADRKPRKSGGRALTADSFVNRDVREANDSREGKKHVGAFKKGGKIRHREDGGMTGAGEGKRTNLSANVSSPDYNEAAVNKAISSSRQKISGREAKLIHAMLKGRNGKFGGGPIGNNPVGEQNKMMGQAAGAMKKGGKVKGREHHSGMDGDNVAGRDQIGEMIRNLPPEEKSKNPAPVKKMPPPPSDQDFIDYKTRVQGDADRAANAAAFDEEQRKYLRSLPQNKKKGGKVSHMEWEHSKKDLAEDRKLAKKHGMSLEKWEKSELDEKHDKQQSTKGLKHGGSAMHHKDCTCKMCGGGRTMKYAGGGVFSGDSKTKIPGATGGRHAHAKGGKAGKGKMNVNIVIATGHGREHGMGQGNMPNEPMPAPKPMAVPPPQAMPVPPANGPQGGPPMPPPSMAMARKSGGRATHVIDHAAGGGLGRLEKIKAYGAKQPKMPARKK